MITLLHGENTTESRKALNELIRAFGGEKISLDGKNLDPTSFFQVISSNSMFEENRLITIENYFSNKKSPELDLENLSADIVFWESKVLTPAVLAKLAKIKSLKVREFKVPTLVFKITDNLKPGNGKELVTIFREAVKTTEAEFIYAMIVRQFRMMLDTSQAQGWQVRNIENQTKLFGEKKLILIYKQLLDLDYKNKTSRLIGSFGENLEIFLLKI